MTVEDQTGELPVEHDRGTRPCHMSDWVPAGPDRWDWSRWEDEIISGDYVFVAEGAEAEACRVREIAAPLMATWPYPTLIEEAREDWPPIRYTWQITVAVSDAQAIGGAMQRWGKESVALTPTTAGLSAAVRDILGPDVFAVVGFKMASAVKRRRQGDMAIPRRHLKVHQVAERQGSWACYYCGTGLIDVCSDADMVTDGLGKRMVNPTSPKALPTFDHLVPQSLNGSNSISNLVLACQSCNSRKGAL